VIILVALAALPHPSFAQAQQAQQEGNEIRAARVCAGIGRESGSFLGTFSVGDLRVRGDANGFAILQRDGVDLGKIEKGTFHEFTECLIKVMQLLSLTPPSPRSICDVSMDLEEYLRCVN
jgi:hypothetical protein